MKAFLASDSPVKLEATQYGFTRAFETHWEITASEVNSVAKGKLPNQPIGDEFTLACAMTRVNLAQNQYPDYDLYIGIEGGVHDIPHVGMTSFAWVYIEAGIQLARSHIFYLKDGMARTGAIVLPDEVASLVRGGMELGPADDQVFGMTDSKKSVGSIGILTKGLINRPAFYEPAVICALIPFLNTHLTF